MGLLAFWSFASRGLGAIRILLVGRLSPEDADIFNAAFVLPDNIIAVFILGSIGLAFLPHIIELHERESGSGKASDLAKEKEAQYITYTSLILSSFIGITSIIAFIYADNLLRLMNPSLADNLIQIGKWETYISITRVLLFAPLIFAIKTIFGSFLNARRKFAVYATDGVITNLGSLLGLTVLYSYFGLVGAVSGVVIGFVISALAFAVDAFRHGLRWNFGTFEGLGLYLTKTLQLYLPRLLIIPAIRVAETMVTLTAQSADGEITILKTALDLQGIPLALITVAAVVFLPDITAIYVKSGFGSELKQLLKKYIRWGSLFSIAGFIGVTAGSPVIFWILNYIGFVQPGDFFSFSENIRMIVICTGITSITLVFQTMVEFYNRVYVAIKNAGIPLLSSLVGNGAGIVLTVYLAQEMGAALATALGFSVNAILQSIIVVYLLPIAKKQVDK